MCARLAHDIASDPNRDTIGEMYIVDVQQARSVPVCSNVNDVAFQPRTKKVFFQNVKSG